MIVKCPACSTLYNLPEDKLGDKPRKMRCSKCRAVFALARRSADTPAGYEEFTGQQASLPSEFAFLREAPEPPAPPVARIIPAPVPAVSSAPPKSSSVSPPPPQIEIDFDMRSQAPPPPVAARPPAVPAQAPAIVIAPSMPVRSQATWETEDPLYLDEYAVPEHTGRGQVAGKIVTVLMLLVVGFLVWVAYRNGWSLKPVELPDQIAFALSDKVHESFPDEVQGLDLTVDSRRVLTGAGKNKILHVKGTIYNTNRTERFGIVLRARLLDPLGTVRSEVRVPCGVHIDDETVKATDKGAMTGHYLKNGALFDCRVYASESLFFEAVFDELPADYDDSYTVVVQPVAARLPG
ncbi:MAG: zinc-ribbon domain-containing protein [Deltaproteobacteria bacterium]|nr:zinc-ribbon domain-containing protein [Deltaproteobacteria bacterium]